MAAQFAAPPDSARPWVYWFWSEGNITREGMTADLEAMRRVGIGGVLIMEVAQDIPKGPVRFGSPQWRELFKHAVAEAGRLGLEVNMNNDAGWSGSGGPWITPAQAMQKLVWTRDRHRGSATVPMRRCPSRKPLPGYYRDIAVLAFPTTANGSERLHAMTKSSAAHASIDLTAPTRRSATGRSTAGDRRLTAGSTRMGVAWDVPPGKWTVLRPATRRPACQRAARRGGVWNATSSARTRWTHTSRA